MLIRSTEKEHDFTNRLFERLKLFSIQGLTMSADKHWTAGVEAIQYDDNETVQLERIFPIVQVKAKYYLSKTLGIPFYFVIWQKGVFKVFNIWFDDQGRFCSSQEHEFDEYGYVSWWSTLKGLPQPKPLLEKASIRVQRSVFDIALEKHDMAWGGNIDGYMFKHKQFACIVENIYTYKHPLESERGEPSFYFFKQGPNYNTWFPTVTLAHQLGIPLFLFTINGNTNDDRIGFTVIDHLESSGIYYRDNLKPNNNIIVGIDNIEKVVLSHLDQKPPYVK